MTASATTATSTTSASATGDDGTHVSSTAEPVWRAIGAALADEGVETVFGLLGSGNFQIGAALQEHLVKFVSARHEGAAIAMADGFARAGERVGVCTVHQGPGLTNLLTGLVEAAKSHTPLLVLAADTAAADRHSNFRIDQHALVEATGAAVERLHDADDAVRGTLRALDRATFEQRPVVLMLPLDVQQRPAGVRQRPPRSCAPRPPAASPSAISALVDLLLAAQRPLIIAGRGAVRANAGGALRLLGERSGALLATTAVANGLFAGSEYCLGICGGFSSPAAVERIASADAIAVFGASLNAWTTGHGALIDRGEAIAHVDIDAAALGSQIAAALPIVGDCRLTADSAAAEIALRGRRTPTWRTAETAVEIADGCWRARPFEPDATEDHIDPRSLTIALDALLPDSRAIVVDSGHFVGWPSMYMRVGDPTAFVFAQAFQSVGLGLGASIGAALARPERLTVGILGDGGALMALGELETLARLNLPILIVIYNDAAYGAEVHCFAEHRLPLDGLVRFDACDLAAVARSFGLGGITVRSLADLDPIARWLEHREGPLIVDARIAPGVRADWHLSAHDHELRRTSGELR